MTSARGWSRAWTPPRRRRCANRSARSSGTSRERRWPEWKHSTARRLLLGRAAREGGGDEAVDPGGDRRPSRRGDDLVRPEVRTAAAGAGGGGPGAAAASPG